MSYYFHSPFDLKAKSINSACHELAGDDSKSCELKNQLYKLDHIYICNSGCPDVKMTINNTGIVEDTETFACKDDNVHVLMS